MGNKNERVTYNNARGDIINQEGRFVTGVVKSDRSVSGQRISDSSIENNVVAADHKAFDDLKQLVTLLQQKFPNANDEEAAFIIRSEIAWIKYDNPPRWQKFLSLKQLWKGLKMGALKAGEHFTEETPWGKAAVGFLEGVMDGSEK